MIHDEFDSYDNSSETNTYSDDDVNYKPATRAALQDKMRSDKRRRLDDLLEERRLKSELDLYRDSGVQKNYYGDDTFSEA